MLANAGECRSVRAGAPCAAVSQHFSLGGHLCGITKLVQTGLGSTSTDGQSRATAELVVSVPAFSARLDLFIVNTAFREIRAAFGNADLSVTGATSFVGERICTSAQSAASSSRVNEKARVNSEHVPAQLHFQETTVRDPPPQKRYQ
ncbi:MAG: hypothetical protein ABWY93_32425 [Mycobacterium sp.]